MNLQTKLQEKSHTRLFCVRKKINTLRDAFHRRHLFSVVIICGRSSEYEYTGSAARLYVFGNQRL